MSVILNEVALVALLESPTGPVGDDLRERAEKVQAAYQTRVNIIIENPTIRPTVEYEIETDAQGLYAVVGLPDQGKVAEYLDVKIAREGHHLNALREAFR